jgi:outer membrane PBP1 activator LpoA protein
MVLDQGKEKDMNINNIHVPQSLDNPHATFNKLTTSVQVEADGWHVLIRFFHTETGAERVEKSSRRWATEKQATQAAVTIAHTMQERIEKSYGSSK